VINQEDEIAGVCIPIVKMKNAYKVLVRIWKE
jgi:hypothetical protein